MKNLNYKQIAKAIENNEPFEHNGTMTGKVRIIKWPDGESYNTYEVLSYSTPIYQENIETGERWYNESKYSVTTSKQQNIVKKVKGLSLC